jgi:signal peptidase I
MPEPTPALDQDVAPDPAPALDVPDRAAPAPARRRRLPDLRAGLERVMPRPVAALAELLIVAALALGLAEGVQAAAIKPFRIPSGSMEPTLDIGQRVLVNRLVYDLHAPRRGDIVVFHPPTSLTCAVTTAPDQACPQGDGHESSTYFIKRVVGLPGDRLSVKDGHPVINGREMTDEPFITPCADGSDCELPTSIVVPPHTVFVMGDNRGNSDDSRFWGPVPDSWVIGQAFLTYWPLNRIGGA